MSEYSFIPGELYKERNIFVTGIYGSGKTTYAKEYARRAGFPFIDFDHFFDYEGENSDVDFLGMLPLSFVTDAIPWNPKTGSTELFKQLARGSEDVKIICCVCTSQDLWSYRLMVRKGLEMTDERYKHYAHYYKNILKQYLDLNIAFYDTLENKYITQEQMYEQMQWIHQYA